MSEPEIILDPIAVLQMTNYFEKHCSRSLGGATFGFIYAKQVELKFIISLTAPLGTNNESVEELLARAEHFQKIRKTKSKTTQSFYLEYDLLGFYLIRKHHEKQVLKLNKLSQVYSKLGAPYTLLVVSGQQISIKLSKDNKQCSYTSEMQTNQKICVDSYNNQNSKSLVKLTIQKQSSMINIFNQKLAILLQRAQKKQLNEAQMNKLAEILDNYDRIKYFNKDNKQKTLEALNYSVLVGLSMSRSLI